MSEYNADLKAAKAELRATIITHLAKCCNNKFVNIEKFIKEDAGRETMIGMVFQLCSTGEGMPIQSAMSLIDSDLAHVHD